MPLSFSLSLSSPSKPVSTFNQTTHLISSFPLSLSLSTTTTTTKSATLSLSSSSAAAAKSQPGPVKKPSANKKKKKKNGNEFEKNENEFARLSREVVGGESDETTTAAECEDESFVQTMPLPKPPAGFVVDDNGKVLLVAPNRTATIVDPANNLPLECVIRRVFTSSQGEYECMLLCPLDMPVLILKSTNIEGWSAVSDDEVDGILPTAAYALAKIQLHLVHSGFCYTARGGFCYSEDDVFDFRTDTGEDVEGLPTEGVEITCFHLAHINVYIWSHSYDKMVITWHCTC